MSAPRSKSPVRIGWDVVAVIAIGVAGVIALYRIADTGQDRSAILAIVSGGATALMTWLVGRRVRAVDEKVEHVTQQVNGRMSELISKVPDGDH